MTKLQGKITTKHTRNNNKKKKKDNIKKNKKKISKMIENINKTIW